MRSLIVAIAMASLAGCAPRSAPSANVSGEVKIGTDGTSVSPRVEIQRGNVGVAVER